MPLLYVDAHGLMQPNNIRESHSNAEISCVVSEHGSSSPDHHTLGGSTVSSFIDEIRYSCKHLGCPVYPTPPLVCGFTGQITMAA